MDITVQEFKQREKDNTLDFFLLDVREPYEHDEFNVGGKLIPLGEITARLDELISHRNDEIVVYCRSGKRSGMAKMLLQQAGFQNVRNLEGGMIAYQNS
ncbi:MAG: rhodanese-like domain-containing protein [Bacteroidota bacterium]